MPRGGARNRSGPPPDPTSGRSETRGLVFTALPAAGYIGDVPAFPMPTASFADLAKREADIWAEAWRTPQAAAWAVETWRLPIIAEYVRLKAYCEMSANASLIAQLHRYRDQLGLTPAGLRENGWAIAPAETKTTAGVTPPTPAVKPERRLRAVGSDGGS